MTYQAVIFDLDGTLVDSEALMFKAGQTAAAGLGLTLTEELFHSMIGTDHHVSQAKLEAAFGADCLPALDAAWGAEYDALKARALAPKPGARALLERLTQREMPLAVATSSRRKTAELSLRVSGLGVFFRTVVTRDCVTRAKPDPEPYLLAAHRVGAQPEACLAFEDSASGARAAMAAGLRVVVVPDLAQVPEDLGHIHAASLLDGAAAAGLI